MSASVQPLIPSPRWSVVFNGSDITGDLLPITKEIKYTEAASGKANHLEIEIEDTHYGWQNKAIDELQGATIDLSIGYYGSPLTPCGTFELDEVELRLPPDVFCMRAVQAGVSKALRSRNVVAYEGQTLTQIAQTVAGRHGLTLVGQVNPPDVVYNRITQNRENDLEFLRRVATAHGYDFQIRGSQLIFYARAALEAQPISGMIQRNQVHKANLKDQLLASMTYSRSEVTYYDPVSKSLITGTATDPTVKNNETLKLNERVENNVQAMLRAGSHLHSHNMKKCMPEIDLPGTMAFRAGMTVGLSGFGHWDKNNYLVQEGTHTLTRHRGYMTSLHLRAVVQGGTSPQQDIRSDEYA